ncbi:MAG: YIP1 family protein, partial [Acidobacteriota bacterium]
MSQLENYTQQEIDKAVSEQTSQLGMLERFAGLFFYPVEVFQDLNRRPTWVTPVLISIVMVILSGIVLSYRAKIDWEQFIRSRIEASGSSMPSDSVIQEQVNIAKRVANFTLLINGIAIPVTYIAIAVIYAIGLMFLEAKTTFKKVFSVVAWSSCAVESVTTLITILILMLREPEYIDPSTSISVIKSNLAALLPLTVSPFLKAIAASFDIFTIWLLILLTIGLAAVGGSHKITRSKAGALVFSVWLLWVF